MTTKRVCGAGEAGWAAAGAAARPVTTRAANACLIQRINGQSAEQLGEEIGGFLRHYVAGKGHLPELLHGNRVGEKGDVSLAAAKLRSEEHTSELQSRR